MCCYKRFKSHCFSLALTLFLVVGPSTTPCSADPDGGTPTSCGSLSLCPEYTKVCEFMIYLDQNWPMCFGAGVGDMFNGTYSAKKAFCEWRETTTILGTIHDLIRKGRMDEACQIVSDVLMKENCYANCGERALIMACIAHR